MLTQYHGWQEGRSLWLNWRIHCPSEVYRGALCLTGGRHVRSKLMLSFHSQVSSKGRVAGAQPELWSITSEITIAVTHLDRMKKRQTDSEWIKSPFPSLFKQNIQHESQKLTQVQVNLKQQMQFCSWDHFMWGFVHLWTVATMFKHTVCWSVFP